MNQENPREYQRKAIDAEIRSLEESLRDLRRRRNALAPISSLHPELFATILSILRLPPSGTFLLGGESDRHLSWLNVAHVCHEWRELALDHPVFWSHVDFTTLTPAGATEMLVRAKSVPLYLEAWVPKYHWDGPRFSTFQKELQPRVSHICQLAMSAEPFGLDRALEGLVSPAPTLEYLSLSGKKKKYTKQPFVPDTIFDGSTPRLSRLELQDCDISWKSPLFRGLRHLIIHTLSADARPSLSVWLNALNEMPRLQTLVLHSASPIAPTFPFDVERTVTLPSLLYINISASPEDCGLALAHLVLPALTSLCLTAISRLENGGDVERMLPYVARHAHGPQDTGPLQSVLIHCRMARRVDILAWPVADIDAEVHDPPTLLAATLSPRVTLSVTCEATVWFGDQAPLEISEAAIVALPLDSLVMLTAQHFWLRCGSRCPLLRRLRVAPFAVDELIRVLFNDDVGRGSPPLPSLTELVLDSIRFDEYRTLRLCDALMRRVEQGVPLEMLDLRVCYPYFPAAVPLLSEIVVDVLDMWDPVIRGFRDSGAEDAREDDSESE
ncbi:hypothetical protein EDB83DRAFT_2262296 [Lactarius deliciosus]|nr:hypothetical protein EDB83DRAFT_2262296 [Lactarius deliciosus]